MPPEEERDTDRDWFAVDPKGQVRDPDASPRRGPPPLGILAGVVVLAIGGIAIVNRMGATDPPKPSPTSAPSSTFSATPTSAAPAETGESVLTVGQPILGVTGRWNLFARGSGVSIRIELARGRVETSPVPDLASGGPVSFVVGPDRVLIRPIDGVPGYVVVDGGPPEVARGALATGGFVFPGPDLAHVWAQGGSEAKPFMSLVAFDGSSAGRPPIPIPADMSTFGAQPDGSGSLIFQGTSGAYAANGSGLRRITTGQVLAGSARGWLVSDCDDRHLCSTALVDRVTGARHDLGSGLGPNAAGQIAPDGRLAAVGVAVTDGWSLLVIDLTTGARRQIAAAPTTGFGQGTLVWSPDSRWLLVVGDDHTIKAIDPRTGRVSGLGVTLPPVDQIGVRP